MSSTRQPSRMPRAPVFGEPFDGREKNSVIRRSWWSRLQCSERSTTRRFAALNAPNGGSDYEDRSKAMNRRRLLLAGLFLSLVGAAASAQDSKAYAKMGDAALNGFECSYLAAMAGNKEQQKRLFLFGYKQGKAFISAVRAKKVKQSDLDSETPMMVFFALQGPTSDFMLGRLYESAQNDVLKDVFKSVSPLNALRESKTVAANEFRKRNCDLIGVNDISLPSVGTETRAKK